MVTAQPGVVVLVRFPFSDLSSSKLRPAVVLAHAGGVDWILCQVTSNPYGDSTAVPPQLRVFRVWRPRTRERRPAGQALHGEPVAVRETGRQPDGCGTSGTGVPSRRGPPVGGALRPSNKGMKQTKRG